MAILTIWVHDRFTSETDTVSSTVSLHANSERTVSSVSQRANPDKPFIFTKWINSFISSNNIK